MRKVFLVGLLLAVAFGCAQGRKKDMYTELPSIFDGSMMGVSLDNDDFFVVPDSLRVVSGGYMSRHGARYLSSAKKVVGLEKGLEEAREAGTLTLRGERFAELVGRVRAASEGRWGLLSEEGLREQDVFGRAFGRNILTRFDLPEREFVEQNAVSSFVPRVVETMYSFTYHTLLSTSSTRINTSEGPEYDELTRFFVSNDDYRDYLEKGEWQGIYNQFVEEHISGDAARAMLGDLPGKDSAWYRKYSQEMYGMLMGLRVSGLEAPTTEWMSVEEYKACWEAANLDMYLKRSLNAVSDEACRAAIPLLGYLLQSGEGEVTEVYGHAETLIPLVSLMGIPSCNYLAKDYNDLSEHWQNYEVAPLGSNLAILTVESKDSGKRYMMVYHNGMPVKPMEGSTEVVAQEDYIAFLKNRIASFSSGALSTRKISR